MHYQPLRALPLVFRLAVKLLARTVSYFLRSVFVLLIIASALYACAAHAATDERGIDFVEPKTESVDTSFYYYQGDSPSNPSTSKFPTKEAAWDAAYTKLLQDYPPSQYIITVLGWIDYPNDNPPLFSRLFKRTYNDDSKTLICSACRVDILKHISSKQVIKCPTSHPNSRDDNKDGKIDRCYAYSCGANGGNNQSGSGLFTSDAGSSGKGCSKSFFESFSPYQCEFEYEHQFTISGSANSPGGKGGIGWKAKYTGKTCGVEDGAEEDVPELITGDEYDPKNQCFTSPNGHKVCAGPQTPEGCASMGGKTVCIDEAPVNNDPCKNNPAGAFCQSAKLPVEGAPTGQADFTGTHPGTGQNQSFYFGGRATGAALGSGSGSDGSGDDGDCDPATETCGDGNGNGDCQGANCGGGNWYEPSNKTYKSVMKDFRSRMEQTPIYNAAGTYLNVSISGSCPNWSLPSTAFTPSYSLSEYFCGQTIMTMLAVMKAALLILCSWLAFRIALL